MTLGSLGRKTFDPWVSIAPDDFSWTGVIGLLELLRALALVIAFVFDVGAVALNAPLEGFFVPPVVVPIGRLGATAGAVPEPLPNELPDLLGEPPLDLEPEEELLLDPPEDFAWEGYAKLVTKRPVANAKARKLLIFID